MALTAEEPGCVHMLCAQAASAYLALSDATSAHDGGPIYVRELDADAVVVPLAEYPSNEARIPSSLPARRRRRHGVLLLGGHMYCTHFYR